MTGSKRTATLADFLLARIAEDEATARQDERHWSEVPDALFDKNRALADVAAKRVVVEVLARCADRSWSGSYAVQEEALRALSALAVPYADHRDYRDDWRP